MRVRRGRPLSPEDRRLWSEVARSVRPLPGSREPEPPPPEPPEAAPPAPLPPGPPPVPGKAAGRPSDPPLAPPLAPLERRVVRALAGGRRRPDATLDLHGLTQAEAHRRLIGFLRRAQASGHVLVLVITGRGRGQDEERGVLRRNVPLWLGLPDLRGVVGGFEEAGPRQGGAGALHVRLRRRAG